MPCHIGRDRGSSMGALRLGFAAILAVAAGMPFGTATADGVVAKAPDPYIYVPPEAVPLTYNWSGFYIGGNIGRSEEHTSELQSHRDLHFSLHDALPISDGVVAKAPDPYIYVPPEAVPLTYNWSGFYIGGNIG